MLGNFWTFDASFKYEVGKTVGSERAYLSGLNMSVGVLNALNKLPDYSTYFVYDPTQYDIRGRFTYVQLGFKW